MRKRFTRILAALALLVFMTPSLAGWGQTKITNPSGIQDGKTYYIGATLSNNTDYYLKLANLNNGTNYGTPVTDIEQATTFTFHANGTNWTIELSNGKFLSTLPTDNGKLTVAATSADYTATSQSSKIRLSNNNRSIQRNNTANTSRFGSYANSQTDVWLIEVVTGYTVTYDCNGGTSNCPDPLVVNNVPAGNYTLASAPSRTDYAFEGWNDGTTTYEAGATYPINQNVTFTAQWTPTFDYINIAPTSFEVPAAGEVIEMTMTTNITSPNYEVVYYTTEACTESTYKPAWFGDVEFNGNTLDIAVNGNDGVARRAYFKVKSGEVESEDVVTVNQAAITVATPEFDLATGTYYEDQLVDITCTTNGATIYYTTDGSAPAANNGTEYDGDGVDISEGTTTLNAIAIKNGVSSSVASATYTVVYPLTTMSQIFSAATIASTTPADVAVTFNNWTVVYTTNSKAYMTDGQYGLVIYGSNHGFTKGKKYSGTKACKVQLYDGGSELTNLTYSQGTGLTQSDAGDLTPYSVTLATLCGENGGQYLGSYVNLGTLTYNGSAFTDGDNTIKPYAGGVSLPTLTNGKTYIVKGVYYIYNSEKQITQYVAGDISAYTAPAITTSPASSLPVPNYVVSAPENAITYETLTVDGSNLQDNIIVELENGASSDFVMSTDLETWGYSITLTPTNNSVTNEEIAVRLKVGKSIADYSDRIILTSTNATTVNVDVTSSVTYAHVTYDGNSDGVTNVPTDNANYSYNQQVTVLGAGEMTKEGYEFLAWDTKSDGTGTTYEGGDKFYITANTTLYAQWVAKSYEITKAAMTHGSVTILVGETEVTSAATGATVTLNVTPDNNYALSSLTVAKTSDPTVTVTVSNNQFTMPPYNVTVSATFVEHHALDIDFESALNTYTNWDFENITKRTNSSKALITPHAGTGYGVNVDGNGTTKTTASITTKSKIANPGKLTCYISKESNNTTSASWKIQTSTNNTSWTDRSTASGSDASMNNGTWNKFEYDLSELSNVYVRVYYDGNSAIRCIDDISLEYTPSEYAVTLSSVSGGTISASDGTTTITSGSGNFETGKTITLTAEGDATHMFSSWSVTETVSGDAVEVTDNSFEMPACAVTVSATFVESWTFTYNINGNVVAEKYLRNNATITLPTTSEYVPEGYGIIGWTETEGNVASPITSATASQNRTLYAVFGKIVYGDFVKVESSQSDWSGYYLIVYETGNVAYDGSKSGSSLDATPNSVSVTISSKTIEYNSTTAASMFKIEKNGDYYTIRSASGYFIGRTANSNGLDIDANTKYNHTIAYSGGVSITSIGGPKLQYFNSGSSSKFRYYASNQQAIALYKASVSHEGAYTHIYPSNATATGDINVSTSGPIVIESGATLNMGSYSLTNVDAAKLVIEDGGQLITSNKVNATLKKTVDSYTVTTGTNENPTDGWYFIASPVDNYATSNLALSTADLYAYDEVTNYWWNAKNEAVGNHAFTTLKRGQGYLYANSAGQTLPFAGEMEASDTEISVELSYAGNGSSKGVNLLGNPFTRNLTGADIVLDGTNITSYYAVENGTEITSRAIADYPIKPGRGFIVQATDDDQTLVFNPSSKGKRNETKVKPSFIRIEAGNEDFMDRAYVQLGEGNTLRKMTINDNVAHVYVMKDGKDYAAATIAEAQGEMPVNFKASQDGQYTITVNSEDMEMGYLHLIDNIAGKDIDLLATPSYTFNAKGDDYESRFRLVFSANMTNAEMGEEFAFISDGQLVIANEGEAILQVIDVTGRVVAIENINGTCSKAINAKAGVYVLRLINGTDVKTQKIVVR